MLEKLMEMGQEPETMDNTDPALKEAIMEVLMQLLMESEAAPDRDWETFSTS